MRVVMSGASSPASVGEGADTPDVLQDVSSAFGAWLVGLVDRNVTESLAASGEMCACRKQRFAEAVTSEVLQKLRDMIAVFACEFSDDMLRSFLQCVPSRTAFEGRASSFEAAGSQESSFTAAALAGFSSDAVRSLRQSAERISKFWVLMLAILECISGFP